MEGSIQPIRLWELARLLSTNLSTFDTSSRGRIVAIFAPSGMVEVDDAIAVIRNDGVVEG